MAAACKAEEVWRRFQKERLKYVPEMSARSRNSSSCAIRLTKLRKMREVEQVAAVCSRIRSGEIEFLLVQTRGRRRWTFPKGGAEAGLTHAQAAAIEAFEEAGVHGRIGDAAFARYWQRSGRRSGQVSAHLCEVVRLSPPKEVGRNRTWFSAREAKAKLREGRRNAEELELARVLERAVARIRLLSRKYSSDQSQFAPPVRDEWNRIEIEARNTKFGGRSASPPLGIQRLAATQSLGYAEGEADSMGEVIPFAYSRPVGRDSKLLSVARKFKALGAGTRIQ